MNSFNPTTKTSEAMQAALQQASANGNPDIRPAHLLVAILDQVDGVAAPVLTATGVDPKTVLAEAQKLVDGYPKASGSNLANPNFNRDALNALTASQELAGELGDEYVSTEVLLAGIARGKSDAADLLTNKGATYDAIKEAFPSVRGSQRVTAQPPTRQRQTLAEYATA